MGKTEGKEKNHSVYKNRKKINALINYLKSKITSEDEIKKY